MTCALCLARALPGSPGWVRVALATAAGVVVRWRCPRCERVAR